jgi:large subunit ribosomal protein L21e
MPRSHGTRRKARSILTKRNVVRGISYLLYDYKLGDKVVVDVDPREHNTTPHRRFHGKIGVVEEVGRRTLKVSVMIGNKKKILQTRFNHIKLLAGSPSVSRLATTTTTTATTTIPPAEEGVTNK